jgi:hypothetical protein
MTAAVPYTQDTFVKMVKDKVDELYDCIRDKQYMSTDMFVKAIHECRSFFWDRDNDYSRYSTAHNTIHYSSKKIMNTERALNIIRQHIMPLLKPFVLQALPDEIKTLKRDGFRIDAASTRDQLVREMQDWFPAADHVVAPRPSPPILDKDGWDGIARPSAPRAARARLAVLAAMRAQLTSINGVLRSPLGFRQGASFR